jgi:hypothetical protein
MPFRTILAVAILWAASLFAVGSIVRAQDYLVNPLPEPRILSGPDFGIRIEGERKGTPVGRLVVRIDNKWVEAEVGVVSGAVRPLR